jgi:hypothetical protein
MKQEKVEICSLDFLMFAYERRVEEEELVDEGYMEDWERSSYSQMRKSYIEFLREHD